MFSVYTAEWVYNIIFNYTRSHEQTEELTQDTLVAAINGLSKFNKQSSLKTWVCAIAINKCKDHLKYINRKKRFVLSVSIESAHEDGLQFGSDFYHPGMKLLSKEQMQFLYKNIEALPEKQKQALILMKLDGMNQKEVADVMKTSPKAVESLVTRAKKNLKKSLASGNLLNQKKYTL